jgi:hypothetical protein
MKYKEKTKECKRCLVNYKVLTKDLGYCEKCKVIIKKIRSIEEDKRKSRTDIFKIGKYKMI